MREPKELKSRNRIGIAILIGFAAILLAVAAAYSPYHQKCDRAKGVFGKIHPGITKAEVKAIAGEPAFVDTSGPHYDIWIFDVPAIFADQPHCFFQKGDSILVRFRWEPIDTSLQLPPQPSPPLESQ